jgi:hypothetical protein
MAPEGDAAIFKWKQCIEVQIMVVSANSRRILTGHFLDRLL